MKSNRLIYILGAVVLLLIIGLIVAKSTGLIKSSEGMEVAVQAAASRTILETVPANGKIFPQTEVKISPEVSGEIIELYVEEGDSVQKGELLVKINPSIYASAVVKAEAYVNQMRASAASTRASYTQMKALFDQQTIIYNRNKKLIAQKVISDAEWEQSESSYKTSKANMDAASENIEAADFNVKSAEASLNEARTNLAKTTIYAPINGIVAKLNVEKGERVVGTAQMAGTELMRISDLNNVEARVDINENDILRVAIGDTAEVSIDAYQGRKFLGYVTEIAYSSKTDFQITTDQVTNFTVKVHIMSSSYADLVNASKGHKFPFRPGMSATVDIQTNKVIDVLSVPIQSVTARTEEKKTDKKEDEGKKEDNVITTKKAPDEVVFVINNGKAAMVKVVTGIQDQNFIEIKSGLKSGDKVVIAPFKAITKMLKDKMAVVVKKEDDLYKTDK